MDWNGDGKHDWKDDAFFLNVVEHCEKESVGKGRGSNIEYNDMGNGDRASGIVLAVVVFLYVIVRVLFN